MFPELKSDLLRSQIIRMVVSTGVTGNLGDAPTPSLLGNGTVRSHR